MARLRDDDGTDESDDVTDELDAGTDELDAGTAERDDGTDESDDGTDEGDDGTDERDDGDEDADRVDEDEVACGLAFDAGDACRTVPACVDRATVGCSDTVVVSAAARPASPTVNKAAPISTTFLDRDNRIKASPSIPRPDNARSNRLLPVTPRRTARIRELPNPPSTRERRDQLPVRAGVAGVGMLTLPGWSGQHRRASLTGVTDESR